MATRFDTAEAVGLAFGRLLPDLLRNLKKVNNVAQMHHLFTTFLDKHRLAVSTTELPLAERPSYTAFFTGMQKGVDDWRAHSRDED